MEVVLVPIGTDLYAMPVEWVREVAPAPALTPLVTGPELVLGLFNLRGEILPLLDTAGLLGLAMPAAVEYAVVVRFRAGAAALAATALPRRALLDPPATPSELPGTTGSYRLGRQLVVLLDPTVLATGDRLGWQDRQVEPASGGA